MYKQCAQNLCVLALLVGACGGTQKPPASPSQRVAISPPRSEAPAPELSVLAAPKDLIAVARVEHVEAASATIAQWLGLPFDLRMLDQLGPGLSRTLRLDTPVEAAASLADGGDTEPPQPYAVFSVGLTSADAGRKMFEQFGRKLEQMSPGIWVTTDETPVTCAIAPALGKATTRLVCGDRRVDVENLLPYVTRGLPLQSLGSADLHVEFKLAPIRERYGQRLRQAKALGVPMALGWLGISDSRVSRPLTDILYALGDEAIDVMDDLDQFALDSRFASNPDRVDLSASVAFSRAHSWSAQALVDAAKRAGTPPAMFFELPADSSLANYVMPENPRLFENVLRRIEALIDGGLGHLEVSQKLRDDFVRNLDQYKSHAAAAACGAGDAPVAVTTPESQPGLLSAFNAWQVCAYDTRPASEVTNLLDSTARLMADKHVQEALGKGAFTIAHHGGAHGLPKGSQVYECKLNLQLLNPAITNFGSRTSSHSKTDTPTKKAKGDEAGTLYIYVVPDGSRMLSGFGTDAKAIEAHLLTIRKATTDAESAKLDVAPWLRTESAVAGGFFTMAHFGARLAARGDRHGVSKQSVEEGLAAAPHHGLTPVPYVVRVLGNSNGPELRWDMRVNRGVFEDLVAIVGHAVLSKANKQ